ncbi:type VI secretion system baseplate subunit TssG [Janthinobacterium sp. PSPC3-1]|uniref:type VI secretion system baseplate subunit TssG n=1 Tax=Janthinobacterium sp. PSPC3-1 TaxID=2804653 RepID=UPI003CFA5E18
MLPAPQWKPDPGLNPDVIPDLIAQLLARPGCFDFFQALRLLAAWLAQQGVEADRIFGHGLHLHGSASLAFAPGQIEHCWADDEGRLHVRAAMIGFLGLHGNLPLHYTDTIDRHERDTGDSGPRAWLDGLSQRALSLFYQAWARYRIECQGDADGGDFLPLQLALAGVAPGALAHQSDSLPAHVIAHYAALLRHRPATAEVMQAVLFEYFGVDVRLQRFIAAWVTRAPHEHTRLAGSNAVLGGGAMLGERCRRADLRLRLVFGPLSREQYDDFLPGRPGALVLRQMLALFGLPCVSFEVRLVLRRDAVRGCALGDGACLGQHAFVLTEPPQADRDDMHYELRFDGSA